MSSFQKPNWYTPVVARQGWYSWKNVPGARHSWVTVSSWLVTPGRQNHVDGPFAHLKTGFQYLSLPASASQVALVARDPPASAEETRPPRGGHGSPRRSSCLENPVDRGAGGLQPVWSHRGGHDWSNRAHVCWSWLEIKWLSRVQHKRIQPGLPHCRQTLYRLSHQGSPQ